MNQQLLAVNPGSGSKAPDLDWSQVRETIKMLNLAIAQLNGSLISSDESVSDLTESFTFMAEAILEIRNAIEQTEDYRDNALLIMIDKKCNTLSEKIQKAIMAFQFYDRFSQNLSHVTESLSSLGELVADSSRLYSPAEWYALQKQIRDRYTMPQEREVFDLILQGARVEEVLTHVRPQKEEKESGEVELF